MGEGTRQVVGVFPCVRPLKDRLWFAYRHLQAERPV